MFSLIWYFGLISFVVSAHSNNDTSHGGYKPNISTTMSALPSTTIPVAKDCVLEMKESEISEIVELFNSDRVHVVDIHVLFSNTSHDKELSDFHVKLLNPVGREILYSLERWQFQFVTWSTRTLNVGIKNFKLHVNKSQNDCIERQKNVTDFAFENMQNIVRSVNLATNYEVWYSFKETSSGKIRQICCQITKQNLPKCNHGCSIGNSFLCASQALWNFICLVMVLFAFFYLMWSLHVFLSRTEFDLEYPKYYKLEGSRMSPSFIFFKIAFEENDRVVSFIRSCALVGVLSFLPYWAFSGIEIVSVIVHIVIVFWGLSFLIYSLYRSKIPKTHDVNKSRQEFENGEFAGIIEVLTFPFNIGYWRKTIKILYTISAAFIERVRMKFENPVLKILALWTCYVLAVLISALYLSIVFLYLTILAIHYPSIHMVLTLYFRFNVNFFDCLSPRFCAVLHLFHFVFLLYFLVYTVVLMTLAIQSFLLGLFLNLIYFIPYFAFFSVLTFYCGNYWKTMEEKYLVLKRLIYEACRDIERVNNGCIPNRHPKREEKVLPVLSKELYDKIREQLLPYDTNLFYFALKMFWAFGFSFGIFKLIEVLNEFNVTGLVQVITTASLGVMPHIFNMIALKTSEEKKKAREEKLKLNVKYMVEDLILENPELARTVLIMQDNSDSKALIDFFKDLYLELPRKVLNNHLVNHVTTEENVEDSEHPCDDDDVEDPELTRLLQEIYGTTTDKNVQNAEHPSHDESICTLQ